MYFDDFLSRLKKDGLPLLTIFFGDSDSVLAEGYQAAKEKFQKDNKEGSVQLFDGNQDLLGEVLGAAQTAGLFSTAQLVVYKHAEKALGGHSEGAVQQLKDYFSNPNPDTKLVFLAPGMRKTAKAVTATERLGWTVQCADIPEWKISGWLKQQAQARGLGLPEDAAQLMTQKIGTDIAYLQQALDQLVVYVHPKKNASLADVRNLPVPGVESELFPFLDAVGSRQTDKAIRLMNQLSEGVDTGTVVMLYQRFRELLLICLGREKGMGQTRAGEKLGLHPFRLKSLWEQSSQFTTGELKRALQDLIHLQAGVVTGRLGKGVPAVLLEWWVIKWGKNKLMAGSR